MFCFLLNMICNLASEGMFREVMKARPKFPGLFTHYHSIGRGVIQNLIDSKVFFFKHFLAAPSAVGIYQGTNYLSFV